MSSKENAVASSWDIWACGVILFVMLTGTFPFNGKNESDISKAIRKNRFKIPENMDLSEEVIDLIDGMLTKEPGLRIKTEEVLKHSWIT